MVLKAHNKLISYSQKRNYQSFQDPQPGTSSVAGEQTGSVYGASPVSSQYGFAEGLPKRQRSDDYSQHSVYLGERAVPTGYTSRDFGSSVSSVTGYSGGPRQSPQTAYGFQQPPTSSSLPTYYPQAQSASSVRSVDSTGRHSQVTAPGGSYSYQTSGLNTGALRDFIFY